MRLRIPELLVLCVVIDVALIAIGREVISLI